MKNLKQKSIELFKMCVFFFLLFPDTSVTENTTPAEEKIESENQIKPKSM